MVAKAEQPERPACKRLLAQKPRARRVANGQSRGLRHELVDGLYVVAEEAPTQLRRANQRLAVMLVHRQVTRCDVNPLQLSRACARHVERMDVLDAALGRGFHRRGRLEVLAGHAPVDEQVDFRR